MALTRYDVQSPFVHDFTEQVLEDKRSFYALDRIHRVYRRLKKEKRKIPNSHWGAGSQKQRGKEVRVSDLIRQSSCTPGKGELLFRLAAWHKPTSMLELGTQLGLSAAYLAAGRQSARMTSLEGHLPYVEWAQKNLDHLQLSHVKVLRTSFEEWIAEPGNHLAPIDLLYLDGDHRQKQILQYLQALRPRMSSKALVIVDDINWSAGMRKAWNEMKALPEVSLSIDLFHVGLLFFQKGRKEKEHYRLVPYSWKPWRLGVFPRLPDK